MKNAISDMLLTDPETGIFRKETINFSLYPRNAKTIIINLHNDHKHKALCKLL